MTGLTLPGSRRVLKRRVHSTYGNNMIFRGLLKDVNDYCPMIRILNNSYCPFNMILTRNGLACYEIIPRRTMTG